MSTYFVGDVHGCYTNLKKILDSVNFDPNIDLLYLTGDLVARGPNSLEVLRLIKSLKSSACTVLGNHDLYLIKTYYCKKKDKKFNNCFNSILKAPDINELIYWLRHQPILHINTNQKLLMSHAGINPMWNINQTQLYAREIENILTSNNPSFLFIQTLNNNIHTLNTNNINKIKKIQSNVDYFTKMRYIYKNGTLNLEYKDIPTKAPQNIYPWFNISNIKNSTGYSIIFGHWASLKNTITPTGIYALDSGCCWGGKLTLLRWEDKKFIRQSCL
ncbi:bis(5'-nucleosyl)-tetraphosphatase [Candidatus Blochmanniella floridana]|uniref:bis(5'-nucleosyl)-tetraphosphatase (symmetrical) n=1 Tax=Blochmanniella floridana TaxID=203907 RepID=Q7VQK4_BLOFL|nr:bis(5'-nucleosyl)-tetraphosphatase [Candidatus Blochmannia floridanus]